MDRDMDRYDPASIEAEWRERWARDGTFEVDLDQARRPFYNLMMFPYPSAEGLHVGNVFAFVGADIQGRYRRALGYDVFEPMGFDAFGMHSENHALKTGAHPSRQVPANIERFRRQLQRIGAMLDWRHLIDTTSPAYYRWTQWLFLELYRAGLAYRKSAPVTWCPRCATVLADEQSAGGRCERCDTAVEVRKTEQWFLRITAYAERLHAELATLNWSEVTRVAQERWIGRSSGTVVRFTVEGAPLEVFTTRVDTLWGVTFIALSQDHPLVEHLGAGPVGGFVTPLRARHPVTGRMLPVVVADHVRTDYGSGAVMGVPAHDRRDHALSQLLGLPSLAVVVPEGTAAPILYEGEGRLVSSGPFTGMASAEARAAIGQWLSEGGQGEPAIRYRLRDWCVSRQRYWGPPIPMIHCAACGVVPVPADKLPVLLPHLEDFAPDGSGASPLARSPGFLKTACPRCGSLARRETDVSDNFLDSAWFFLRYPSTDRADRAMDPARTRRWLPVSMYVGGNEHAVLHLLYTRFVCMALHDLGHLDTGKPFHAFRAHGLLIRDGRKMSKSRGNVVNPDVYLDRYGADVFRLHLMFLGDFQQGGDFRDDTIAGMERFVRKVWRYATQTQFVSAPPEQALRAAICDKARRVTAGVERLHYNTAIAAIMELLQALVDGRTRSKWGIEALLVLLQPFAPFVTQELWARLGHDGLVCDAPWPEIPDTEPAPQVVYAVQVDGRHRDTVSLPRGSDQSAAVGAALGLDRVRTTLGGRNVVRAVWVPDRVVNLITK